MLRDVFFEVAEAGFEALGDAEEGGAVVGGHHEIAAAALEIVEGVFGAGEGFAGAVDAVHGAVEAGDHEFEGSVGEELLDGGGIFAHTFFTMLRVSLERAARTDCRRSEAGMAAGMESLARGAERTTIPPQRTQRAQRQQRESFLEVALLRGDSPATACARGWLDPTQAKRRLA